MKLSGIASAAGSVLAAGVLALPLLAGAGGKPAQAGVSIQIGPGGFGLYSGPRYYGPRYYQPYYAPRPYYYVPPPPVYYTPPAASPYGSGHCAYYADACARNWGWRNNNWYGCMRYHGCR
ncbi:MAG: hypothetical protein AB7U38_13255 [Hyphomicrobiales bacterium]